MSNDRLFEPPPGPEEPFTSIPGFPGYRATRGARVYSVDSNWRGYGVREMQQTPNSDGYPSVRILVGGRRKRISVHRIMAAAFLPDRPSDQHEVRHLDGDILNSSPDNLAWGTQKDNAADRDRHGRTARGLRHGRARLSPSLIREARTLYAAGGVTIRQLAAQFGVAYSTMRNALQGRTWKGQV